MKSNALPAHLRVLSPAGLCLASLLASLSPAHSGSFTWNFDSPEQTENLVLAGNRADGGLVFQPSDGRGDANTSGYLQLTDGTAGGQNVAIVFPDVDNSLPIKAFKLTAYLRVGNGTERPADGFSVSFARENDPALTNIQNNVFGGFAGGDSLAAAQGSTGSGNAESGTKTGVSVAFDAWEGNWLPDIDERNSANSNDREGIAVRVDDRTLTQVAKTVRNGSCTDTNSLQTGPYDAANPGSAAGLCWAPLTVELTTNNQVTVTWKGATILDRYQLTSYSPHRGRLVLATRTGDAYQNLHVDDVTLTTVPATEPVFEGLTANGLTGFTFRIADNGPILVTNVSSVLLNGTNNITGQVNISSQGGVTTGTYTQTDRFPSSSTQNLTITVNTSLGQSVTFSNMVLSVPNYFVMPASYRLDPAAVSTPGFKVNVYETTAANPNTVLWTEEQLLGLHGPNLADTNVATSWAGVIDFDNGQSAGNFENNTPFSELGLGVNPEKANTDNITAEFTTYVNFPAAGEYEMVVNSDDGFLVSTARNPQDRLGDRIFEVSFGRGISTGVDAGPIQRIIVDQPGVYPLRLLFENGGGGAGVEWYTRQGTNLTLINDTAPEALKAFQNATSSAAYVSRTSPIRGSTGVSPLSPISVTINDGDRRVNESTVAMTVNGTAGQPTVTRAGTATTVTLNAPSTGWGSNAVMNVQLTFSDNASPASSYNYNWQFTTLPYSTAPILGGLPLGSQDPNQPGFLLRLYQVDQQGTVALPNRIHVAEQVLAGLWGANISTNSGTVTVPGVFNFNIDANNNPGVPQQQGNFGNDNPWPGLPIGGTFAHPTESFAADIRTWVAFPQAGLYVLGFNSDDGFSTMLGTNAPAQYGQLVVNSPASIAGPKAAVLGSNRGDAVGTQPTNAVTGRLVLALGTGISQEGCGQLSNAAQLAGNIAVVERGTCGFQEKVQNAASAGALAVVVINNRPEVTPEEGAFPIEMTGGPAATIPALMVSREVGLSLTNAMNAGEVNVTINPVDMSASLGSADVGRGATDTLYGVNVPSPGLYPLRTVYWQGGGGGNAEWFSVTPDGTRVLLNDVNDPRSLKTFTTVTVTAAPRIEYSYTNGTLTLRYQGTLESSATVEGGYTPVEGATSPYQVPTTGTARFFRSR